MIVPKREITPEGANDMDKDVDIEVARLWFGDNFEGCVAYLSGGIHGCGYHPSTSWDDAGPIIDRHKISIKLIGQTWIASFKNDGVEITGSGKSAISSVINAYLKIGE